jgi:hypothetical protein
MKRVIVFLFLLLLGVSLLYPLANPMAAEESTSQDLLWESFEKSNSWQAVANSWNNGNGSTKVKAVADFATEGKKGLCLSFKMAKSNSATYYTDSVTGKWSNWTNFSQLKVDVNNTISTPLKMTLALMTGNPWIWLETQTVDIKPGLNTDVTFPLKDFKTEATGWQFTSELKNANDMHRVVFQFFGEVGLEGDIYIDNIRLTPVTQ